MGQTGGGKALLYHAISLATSDVLCAKVYRIEEYTSATLIAEKESSIKIHEHQHYPEIVKYLDVVSFQHESAPDQALIAFIMPLYKLSLAAAIEAFYDIPFPVGMFTKLALSLLCAGARFQELKLVHCDIKPENVMMSDANFVLIDLGAVSMIGQPALEYTPGYGLQAPLSSLTPEYDLNCISVTLLRCCAIQEFEVTPALSKRVLMTKIEKINDTTLKNVLTICVGSCGCQEAYESVQKYLGSCAECI